MTPSLDEIKSRYPSVSFPIYLDNQASTRPDPSVAQAMLPYLEGKYGNPHASAHAFGWEADAAVEIAREHVAALIGAQPNEIVFTSGATESNNLAFKGVMACMPPEKDRIVTTAVEHKCVLESCRALEAEGRKVSYLPVRENGIVDPDAVLGAATERTALVSVMAANNETGTVQPVAEVGAICRERGVLFHVDAAQGAGKIPLDVRAMSVDLMSLSAHKMYGPKGIGALFVRRKPRIRLEPLLHGGGQERGLRSGTLPTMLAVGFGEAARLALTRLTEDGERLARLSDLFLRLLRRDVPDLVVNGDAEKRVPGSLNLAFPGIEADAMISSLRLLAVSSGSACASSGGEPSYVLRAIGLDKERIRASVRFGLGRFTTEGEVRCAAEMIGLYVRSTRDG
jgi:cysteine desulfurase